MSLNSLKTKPGWFAFMFAIVLLLFVMAPKAFAIDYQDVDFDDYILIDAEMTPASGWNATTGFVRNYGSTVSAFASSKMFGKSDLPDGTLLVIEEGYKYRPDGWVDLSTPTPPGSRPGFETLCVVEINNDWWKNFNYCAFNVTKTSEDSETKDAPFRIYVPKVSFNSFDDYILIDAKLTPASAWDSRSQFTKNYGASVSAYTSSRMFGKSDLPDGTLLVVEEGYQYRPDGWVNLSALTPEASRPGFEIKPIVEVNNTWWRSFNHRAFNVTKINSGFETKDVPFRIYVPKASFNNFDDYILIDAKMEPESGWNATTGFAKNFGSSVSAYASSKMFEKSDLPEGTLLVVEEGYQYRPDGWVNLSTLTPAGSRPGFVEERVVEIKDTWWKSFNYRAFNVTKTSSNSETKDSPFRIYVPKAVFNDFDDYILVDAKMEPEKGWNATTGFERNPGSTVSGFIASRMFGKSELPEGTLLVVEEGYQYRPDGWVNLSTLTPANSRPGFEKNRIVEVKNAWWGSFNYRAFNVTKIDAGFDTKDSPFRIYVPKTVFNNFDDYILIDAQMIPESGWNATSGFARNFGATVSAFTSSKMFEKSDLPEGTLLVVEGGYQYRPDGWVNLSTLTPAGSRPGFEKERIVEVKDVWWENFNYRAFNVTKINSGFETKETPFKIYVPKKLMQYTITYNGTKNGGDPASRLEETAFLNQVIDLTYPIAPTANKDDGWKFIGWNTESRAENVLDSVKVDSNIELYAIYKKELTATFFNYRDTQKTKIIEQKVIGGIFQEDGAAEIDAPIPGYYQGWDFIGWVGGPDVSTNGLNSPTLLITEDQAAFYGLYERQVTLNFNPNGSEMRRDSVTCRQTTNSSNVSRTWGGQTFLLPEGVSKSGADFSGWALHGTHGTKYQSGLAIIDLQHSARATMYATWNPDTDKTNVILNGDFEESTPIPFEIVDNTRTSTFTRVKIEDDPAHFNTVDGIQNGNAVLRVEQDHNFAQTGYRTSLEPGCLYDYQFDIMLLTDNRSNILVTMNFVFDDENADKQKNHARPMTRLNSGEGWKRVTGTWDPSEWELSDNADFGNVWFAILVDPGPVMYLLDNVKLVKRVQHPPATWKADYEDTVEYLAVHKSDTTPQSVTEYYVDAGGKTQRNERYPYHYDLNRWYVEEPESFTRGWDKILKEIGTKGTPDRRLAVAHTFSYFRHDMAKTKASIWNMMQAAEEHEIPIYIHLDGVMYWKGTGLWNWFDDSRDDYNSANYNNVERFWWGTDNTTSVKIGWRDWGALHRVEYGGPGDPAVPAPNLASQAFRDANAAALGEILPEIITWYNRLPSDKKYLLAGVVLGMEISPYMNAYYCKSYETADIIFQGNDLWDQDPGKDAVHDVERMNRDGMAHWKLGYAAAQTLKERGDYPDIQTKKGVGDYPDYFDDKDWIKDETIDLIMYDYFKFLIEVSLESKVPAKKLITHSYPVSTPASRHMYSDHSIEATMSIVDGVVPGWSAQLANYDERYDLDKLGNRPWAAIEVDYWAWGNFEEKYIADRLNEIYNHGNCRHANIKDWESPIVLSKAFSGAIRIVLSQ